MSVVSRWISGLSRGGGVIEQHGTGRQFVLQYGLPHVHIIGPSDAGDVLESLPISLQSLPRLLTLEERRCGNAITRPSPYHRA